MAILPALVTTLQEQIDYINNVETTTKNGKSFLFDFSTGDFVVKDGKLVEVDGIEALKVWIEKVIKSEKNKYKIYDQYGATLQDLLSNNYQRSFVESEIQREITEALLKNSQINSITNFTFSREKRGLAVSFTVDSSLGGIEMSEIAVNNIISNSPVVTVDDPNLVDGGIFTITNSETIDAGTFGDSTIDETIDGGTF